MSEDEDMGSRALPIPRRPSFASTLSYDAAGSRPPSIASTLMYDDDRSLSPLYYPNYDNSDNVDRPWMSTRESRERYSTLQRFLGNVCGRRADLRGWDRIQENPVPLRKCKCCGQRIRNKHHNTEVSITSYVLVDREYTIVDNVLSRVCAEMLAAVDFRNQQRHLSNVYHILVENDELLKRGLKPIIYRKCRRAIDLIHSLFNEAVPERDVQTW
jgi:hypothetical protein